MSDFVAKCNLSIQNAKSFINSITGATPNSYVYAYIGRNTAWPDENDPPAPVDSLEDTTITTWNQMIAAKRILSSDVSLGIRRINWTYGTAYSIYDSANGEMYNEDFYVINQDYRVYKCLDNNNGAVSTVEPTTISTSTFTTTDGYKWKFMFEVTASDLEKWKDDEAMPVKTLTADDGTTQWTVQEAAVGGTIDTIVLESAGSGYVTAPSVQVVGDGASCTAIATISGGAVTKITVTNPGSGYTYATVTVGGTATGRAIIAPIKGHGADPVEELGGRFVIANYIFSKDEDGVFPTDISYRQIGLVLDPLAYGTTNKAVFTGAATQMYGYALTSVSGTFTLGETLVGETSGATAVLVSYSTDTNVAYLNNIKGTFSLGETMTGAQSASQGVLSTITNPSFEIYSGYILYIENRSYITRQSTQIENGRLICRF